MRTHRVGTVTLGVTMIVIGLFFMAQTVFSLFSYEDIFKVWPVIFILLGGEILFANARDKGGTFIYDKLAIGLVIILTCFAMLLAVIGYALQNSPYYGFSL